MAMSSIRSPSPPAALSTLYWPSAHAPGRGGASVWRIRHHAATGPHDHVFHEIVFIEAGTVRHHTAVGVRMLRPGDLIIIRPLAWHAYENPDNLTLINCLIDRRMMHQLLLPLRQEPAAFDLFTRPLKRPRETPPLVFHALPTEAEMVLETLERIMAEQRSRRRAWEAMAVGSLLRFLALIVRVQARAALRGPAGVPPDPGAVSESVHLPDRAQRAVFDTVMQLEQNPRHHDSLRQLAEKVHLSPGHLSRSFARRMGMGIAQYRNRLRLEEACRLLAHTDSKLAQVAQHVGYPDSAYLARRFRATLGQTPRRYRLQSRGW